MIPLGTGSAAAAVALVMVLAPGALGAVTLHAPYTGVSSKFGYGSFNGCEKNSGASTWSFSTGSGGASASSTAKTCLKNLAGVGKNSYGQNEAGIEAAVNVKLPNGPHQVAANWNLVWTASGSEAFSGACPPPAHYSYHYNYSSATYAYWDNGTSNYGSCSSDTNTYAELYGWIQDITNNTQIGSFYHTIVDNSMDTYNYTDYGCYNDTSWSSSNGYSYYANCYAYNTTTTTTAYFFNDTMSGYGNYINPWTGPTSFHNSTTSTPTAWFNYTYKSTHHYAMVFEFYADTYSSVYGWSHAAATSSNNMMTLGNGAKLVSIVIT